MPIKLENTAPIVVDAVSLQPFTGVPAPEVLNAQVVGPSGELEAPLGQPVKGRAVCVQVPVDSGTHLQLTVTTKDEMAFTSNTQIAYHLLDGGPEYVSIQDIGFNLCAKGVAIAKCQSAFARAKQN